MTNKLVLTTNAKLSCSDQGSIAPTSTAKLTVDGYPVLIEASLVGKSVACPLGNNKCNAVSAVEQTAKASRLTISSEETPVVIFISSGIGKTDQQRLVLADNIQQKLSVATD